jgi:hypothetical protein
MKISKDLLDYIEMRKKDFPKLSIRQNDHLIELKMGITTICVCDCNKHGEEIVHAFVVGMVNGRMYS